MMCVWSPYAGNLRKGVRLSDKGTVEYNVIGAWVLTDEEAQEYIDNREDLK